MFTFIKFRARRADASNHPIRHPTMFAPPFPGHRARYLFVFILLAGLPQDLSRLLRAARKGRLDIHIDVLHLKRVGNQLDRALSRLVVGIMIAALIIGSSIVLTVQQGPQWLGTLGFLIALLGSLWLILSIWASNRRDRDDD